MWFLYAIASAFFFGLTNVFSSIIVNVYEKRPVVYLFYAGAIMGTLLLAAIPFYDPSTDWMMWFVVASTVAYIGDLFYYYALRRIDVSVVNACWAILAVFVSIGGFLLFHERWTVFQGLGAFLVLGGIFVLSYWHKHISIFLTVCLFSVVALFYTPGLLIDKAALLAGENAITITYWIVIGRVFPDLLVPLCRTEWREGVRSLPQRVHPTFFLFALLEILVWFIGLYTLLTAFELGQVSLVSIAGNVQPFFVVFQAWLFAMFLPRFAPRELLTAQSVQVKLVSFLIVFAGLALLALG